MTKRKDSVEAEAKRTGMLRRAAVSKQLRDGGPQTAAQVHAVIGGEFEDVRNTLYRMVKSGAAKSERMGGLPRTSIFRIADQSAVSKDVNKPFRPVLQEWEPIIRRDPLHCFLFGAPEVRAAA